MNNPLDQFKWKNRIVLIFNDHSELIDHQLEELISNQKALDDRDIVHFLIDDSQKYSVFNDNELSYLITNYNKSNDPFRVVLIGKDGGVKRTIRNAVFSSDRLISLIDSMPMRKAEMERDH